MPVPELSERHLSLLRQYDTPTICNVIELFAVRPRNTGYMDARIRACYPEMPPAVGYAATALFRGAFERPEGASYATLDDQVRRFAELPGRPIVVFQDVDDPPVAATFGEVMCSSYKAFGAVGIVTSGAARDLEQVRRFRFPAFAGSVICSHGYSQITALHVPVRVGGIPVLPGDLLHADANGVTTIPHDIAADVAEAAEEFVAAEAVVLDYLKDGKPDQRLYSEALGEKRRRISSLSGRLRRNFQ